MINALIMMTVLGISDGKAYHKHEFWVPSVENAQKCMDKLDKELKRLRQTTGKAFGGSCQLIELEGQNI